MEWDQTMASKFCFVGRRSDNRDATRCHCCVTPPGRLLNGPVQFRDFYFFFSPGRRRRFQCLCLVQLFWLNMGKTEEQLLCAVPLILGWWPIVVVVVVFPSCELGNVIGPAVGGVWNRPIGNPREREGQPENPVGCIVRAGHVHHPPTRFPPFTFSYLVDGVTQSFH